MIVMIVSRPIPCTDVEEEEEGEEKTNCRDSHLNF